MERSKYMGMLDYLVALVFALLILLVGLTFSRSSKSMNSFFAAGGAVPWWISGLSLFMSFFSVGTFVVWGSIAYSDGLVSIAIQMTMAIAGIVIGLIIAPAWNKTRSLTAAEFITRRLGQRTQKTFSVAFLFVNLFTAGAFLYPVGKIIEVSTGLPLTIAIVALGLFIIAYTTVGGLWAVLVTDVLQFVVLTAAVCLMIPLSFEYIGGLDNFIDKAPADFFNFHNNHYDYLFLFAFAVYNTVFIGGNWAYVQRYTSVSSPSKARKVGLSFGLLYLIAPIIWMIPPMLYRVINPDLAGTQSEDAYLLMSKLVVPEGVLGLVLAAMVFATASSVNTTINIAAGVFTNDLFKSIKPNLSQQSLMLVARISTFAFGMLAVGVALSVQNMGGIVEVVLTVAAVTGTSMYLPPIWAMFSKRQTGKTILSATAVSLTCNLLLKFAMPLFFSVSLNRGWEMMAGVLIPVLILSALELYLIVRGKDTELFRHYSSVLSQQNNSQNKKPISTNQKEVGVLHMGIAALGFLFITLGVIAETARIETMIVGCLVLLTPATFYVRQFKNR